MKTMESMKCMMKSRSDESIDKYGIGHSTWSTEKHSTHISKKSSLQSDPGMPLNE